MGWFDWRRAAAVAGLVILTACGGGGGSNAESSDGNLYVSFDYPQQVQTFALFDSVSIAPAVGGLGDGKAHFRVRDGSTSLPQGMTLNESTGVLSGYAGEAGSAYVWIDLTVDGYESAVSSLVSVNVSSSIALSYPIGSVNGRVGTAITPQQPTVTGLQTGDSLANFRLRSPSGAAASALPLGVTLDAQTGTVSGAPTAAGIYGAFVAATVVRGDMRATIQAPSYLYFSIGN